jgi:hypothetical protein
LMVGSSDQARWPWPPSRVLDLHRHRFRRQRGTGAVIGKSIERVYVDGDDSVYYASPRCDRYYRPSKFCAGHL